MTRSAIRREAPPVGRGRNSDTAKRLRDDPGEWYVIREPDTRLSAYAMAYQIRSGTLASFRPSGSFEAQGRTVNGTFCVYARYIGEGGEYA